jgi:hypothetical protein
MARIAERLSRIEAATGTQDDAAAFVRLFSKRFPPNDLWESPAYRDYLTTVQGRADQAAAERYEAGTRRAFAEWLTADELQRYLRG